MLSSKWCPAGRHGFHQAFIQRNGQCGITAHVFFQFARFGERFFDAAMSALDAIGRMPGAGSPRVGEVCGIDGLRVRRIPNFPCGWFYFASDDRVDVVRLLADAQDIAAVLADMEHE